MSASLVGSEMCIRDRPLPAACWAPQGSAGYVLVMPNGHYARWMPQREAGYLLAMPYGHQRWMLLGNPPQRRTDAGL
eukprot:7855115-Alexandrium_andersonii.AAC.1